MSFEGTLAVILILLSVTLGPSLGIGMVGYASIRALGRNPSAAPKILLAMIIAFIFVEAIAIIGLLVVFNVFVPTQVPLPPINR